VHLEPSPEGLRPTVFKNPSACDSAKLRSSTSAVSLSTSTQKNQVHYLYQLAAESNDGFMTRAWAIVSFSLMLDAKYHDSIITPPLADTNIDWALWTKLI
jgi:hypothetical protein